MKTRNIHQVVLFKAPVSMVYKALMDSRQHSKITDSKAVIGSKAGSAFSVWDGGVNGMTLSLAPNKTIVQAWRSEEWVRDHYSIVTFSFQKVGAGTKLTLDQYGVPSQNCRDILNGWKTYYWRAMKALLEK